LYYGLELDKEEVGDSKIYLRSERKELKAGGEFYGD